MAKDVVWHILITPTSTSPHLTSTYFDINAVPMGDRLRFEVPSLHRYSHCLSAK